MQLLTNRFSLQLTFLLLLLSSFLPAISYGEEIIGIGETTRVRSKVMISQEEPKLLHFMGGVITTQEKVEIQSEELKVVYHKKAKTMKKIVAIGQVVITSKTRLITGDRADMFPKEKKIIIIGNATVKQEGEDIKGEKIIYFYERDDIIVGGGSNNRAKMVITPKKKKDHK